MKEKREEGGAKKKRLRMTNYNWRGWVFLCLLIASFAVWPQTVESKGKLEVYFLDVGQADAIFVRLPNGQNMLIDAGNEEDGPAIVSFLRGQGVKKLHYVVATHPHEDHIGGMDKVIDSLAIGKVYMPRVEHTTDSFAQLLMSLKAKKLKAIATRADLEVIEDRGLRVVFLAPCREDYEELNDFSGVVKIRYGNKSFLLTGDAGKEAESDMLKRYPKELKADVLKVSHHGSAKATSRAFLRRVSPRYAVISVGKENDYGHPHKKTLENLRKCRVKVYRTDRDGTILVLSDGVGLRVIPLGRPQKVSFNPSSLTGR